MNELKRIKKELERASKQATCDNVFPALWTAKSCKEELNHYTPKNKREETQKTQLLNLCENYIEWANYWAERIA